MKTADLAIRNSIDHPPLRLGFLVILVVVTSSALSATGITVTPFQDEWNIPLESILLTDVAANVAFAACAVFLKRSRRLQRNKKMVEVESALMTSPQLPNLTEDSSAIRVAIVYTPEAIVLADSLEALLAEAKGFTFSRFDYDAESGFRPDATGFGTPDVVVAALDSFETTKLELLFASLQRTFPHRPVLVTTRRPDAFDVFPVLEMGASDFLLPPLRRSELLPRLKRQALVACRGDALVQKLKEDIGLKQIIGESPAFLDKVQCIPRFARCDATVLISGESGTGKELFARAIHYLSPRADRPFVPVNCGALPENLVESELFGHKRGAFTGAASDHAGLIREAGGGTLFLDEIDTLTPQAQVKLLRLLQDGEYRSVGSQQILHANIRVVAAANADFTCIMREGKFREDLFYRLNVLTLTLPPLRERPGDILLLTRDFLEKQAAITTTRPKHISLAALNRLLVHSWPGNVRELQNVLMRAIVLSDRCEIKLSDLNLPDNRYAVEDESFQTMKSRAVQRFEHDFLATVLHAHDGNITRAASAVKKNRRAFWELLRKHRLLTSTRRG
jgi:two-component system, NtrC family, response regulator GlrR